MTDSWPDTIKWSRDLKRRLRSDRRESFSEKRIILTNYRPYSRRLLYVSPLFTDVLGLADDLFPIGQTNPTICFTDPTAQKPWMTCAINRIVDLHYVGSGAGTVCVARYYFRGDERLDNVTDWALGQFVGHYGTQVEITADDIFAYVYGVLHDPLYRETYSTNLKREFPRIPFYRNFKRWRDWGQTLLDLHIGYESATTFPLIRTDVADDKVRATGQAPLAILRGFSGNGVIVVDTETQLSGVPPWRYQLGSRSAVEWVLDQHRERVPKDLVIREKFNSYRFADYKEQVIDLLGRVVTVSVRTVEITEQMREASGHR